MIVRPSHARAALLALGGALALAGCETTAADPQYQRASAVVTRAQNDSAVQTYAKDDLAAAQASLQNAAAARSNADGTAVTHLSYIAAQRAEIAEARAMKRQNLAQIDTMSQQREQILRSTVRQEQAARDRALQPAVRATGTEQSMGTDLPMRQTDRGTVLTISDFLFEPGTAALTAAGGEQVMRIARYARDNPLQRVVIEGHADDAGTANAAMSLSHDRAAAVRQALLAYGLRAEQITAAGLGGSQPIASNATPAGRERNRRVEVILVN